MRYARYALAAALMVTPAVAQDVQPTNDAPNPFTTVKEYFKLPAGRSWGSTSAVDIDKDGKSIWIAERCGQNSCLDRTAGKMMDVPTVMKFDANGTLVTSFGAGMLIFPHGIHVDRDGNVWVTDGQDNAPLPQRGAGGGGAGGGRARGEAPTGPIGPRPGATMGNQVYKFSPDGKVLLTLGKPGGAAAPDYFYQPNDVVTAPNGDIFVSEGHGAGNNRILKFDKTGKFIKEWGKLGTGPGEFDQPHALAFDGQGRLFVGDRNNNRVQVFDQDGKYITEYKQFSRPSGIFIKGDILYVADSESESVSQNHNGWHRGIRMGSIKDGRIQGFIPDPETRTRAADNFTGTSAAEGVAVDAAGNIYGAEVGPKAVKKYVKK
ncbi:MAG TPA: peptidyl-alpha-hydroxyglycine alpha-amidating lyase family protein [Vicinamibacterales bacterium]|nr:peptidyl-alpha-hydroxyglycine alpha-amidating lyase family protein [Vicinamibacterales bacterium]